jgi:hypothetical protein
MESWTCSKIKFDCPDSYKIGTKMLKKIGNNIFKDKILENWNKLLRKTHL